MELCDDGHAEICFTVRECPLCKMRAELREELDEARRELTAATINRVLDWIDSQGDAERVIYTGHCAAELGLTDKEVADAFAFAVRWNFIGWDQLCYYTIQRGVASTASASSRK
jgi:hypothetical protein